MMIHKLSIDFKPNDNYRYKQFISENKYPSGEKIEFKFFIKNVGESIFDGSIDKVLLDSQEIFLQQLHSTKVYRT